MSDDDFEASDNIDEADWSPEAMEEVENQLVSIVQRLINSGEIQVLNSAPIQPMPLPEISRNPDLNKLTNSAIYQNIKQASGYGAGNGTPTESFSLAKMIANRQSGIGPEGGAFVQSEKCKINNIFLPNRTNEIHSCDSKVFCGRFTRDNSKFVTVGQDAQIRIFDASNSRYPMVRQIEARGVSWSILDIDFSPDDNYYVYSTWTDILYFSRMENMDPENIHCLHLHLEPTIRKFGVFTVAFSNCGKQVVAGANDGCIYAYDLVQDERVLMVPVTEERHDVNNVGFLDETSNIFFSGTDNGIIKIWDRRCMNEENAVPAGVFVGHHDGITYIDSSNDGRYILSNSKDQSIKLWDLRVVSPPHAEATAYVRSDCTWDYRWSDIPNEFYNISETLKGDTSVMTYQGHRVQKSLIRAKFSPAATTGQRFIYTGCSTGRLIIYDSLTGKMVAAIESHKDIVRDASWHPHRTEVLTSSWDSSVNLQSYKPDSDDDADSDDEVPPLRRSRRIAEQRLRQSRFV